MVLRDKKLESLSSPVRAPAGAGLHCRSWQQEAALRMLMNSLDPAVAECPEQLIACGPAGKVAQDMVSAREIVRALISLDDDKTLLIDSGKLAGILQTDKEAPRVVTLRRSRSTNQEDPSAILAIHTEVSAAGWVWVGAQGVLPAAYETFAAAARTHFGGSLAGRLIISGGLGGAGGAQPFAAVLNGAAFLGIEADAQKITRRVRAGYCDYCVNSLDEALRILKNALRRKEAISVGLTGNCADVLPELAARGVCPDLLTDETAAHDPLNGYIPSGLTLQQTADLRERDQEDYLRRAYESIGKHVTAMLQIKAMGSVVFDFGNCLAATAFERAGVRGAADIPDFASYLQPLLAVGSRPLVCVALSGAGADIQQLDETLEQLFPGDEALTEWLRLARRGPRFQGLPARTYWLDAEQRVAFAERANELVSQGRLQAPAVMAIDLAISAATALATATVAAGQGQEHEAGMVADLVTGLAGASWLAVDVGGEPKGVVAIVVDGDLLTEKRIRCLLTGSA
ncbi:MAG: urocanate hydratase [Terriglobia bacterium]